jgi:hypothetical protein
MNLDGYIPVHERLRRALERFPDLHVVEDGWRLVELGDRSALECVVRVYRTVDDPLPVVGTVLEPFPGSTPFTRGSELMVGFTSALGRALGYLGVGLEAGLASRDEIAARTGPDRDDRRSQEPVDRPPTIPGEDRRRRPPTEKMLSLLRTMLEERDVILDPADETATLADFDACRRKLDELQAMPKVRR